MPLWIALVPFAVFLCIFAVFGLVDLANLWRYRSGFFSAAFLTLFFLTGTIAILYGTYYLLAPIDWYQTIGTNFSFTVPVL